MYNTETSVDFPASGCPTIMYNTDTIIIIIIKGDL
jgi:hypothetical protein